MGYVVLHVVESFGGGVADAMFSYLKATPEYKHHLLYSTRAGITVDPEGFELFDSYVAMPIGHWRRVRSVKAAVDRLQPDLVHAHSSYAGAYVRGALNRRRVPILYTPHCFSFEREDISGAFRFAFLALEWLLASNTSVFAACSKREASLSRRLAPRRPVVEIVNVARELPDETATAEVRLVTAGKPMIAMAGRLAPQKGAAVFASLATELGGASGPYCFTWIGGGDPDLAKPLIDVGVKQTGWISSSEVRRQLRCASLYVHTAAWEGFPVAALEAVYEGVPILVLRRPYTEGLPDALLVSDADLPDRVRALLDDDAALERQLRISREAFADHTVEHQRTQLLAAYALATGGEQR